MDIALFGWQYRLGITIIFILSCSGVKAQFITNGYGIYEEFGAPLYAIKLESQLETNSAPELMANSGQKKLSLRVLAEQINQRQWCRFWGQNIAINLSGTELERMADSLLSICNNIQENLKMGDQITFYREADNSAQMTFNSTDMGRLGGNGVYEAFLSPFLGRSPVNNALKSSLLTNSDENSQAGVAYKNSVIAPERMHIAEAWIDREPEPTIPDTPKQQVASNAVLLSMEVFDEDSIPQEIFESKPLQGFDNETSHEEQSRAIFETLAIHSAKLEADFQLPEHVEIEPAPREKLERATLVQIQEYQNRSLRQVYHRLEYPAFSQRRGREGALRLMVEIDRVGNIHSINYLEEAVFEELNEAAITAVEDSLPFDPPPLAEDEEFFELLLPIRFTLE